MPLPLLLPLLFTAGSIGANYLGNQKASNAVGSAMAAERKRQNKLDEEAYALNNAAKDRYTDVSGQTEDRSASLSDMYTQALDAPETRPMAVVPESDSSLVVAKDAASAANTRAESEDRARRLGAFRGFGDMFGDISRSQAGDASHLGMLGSFKRGSQGVLPMELDAASQKGKGWMMLGDLLNMAGGFTLNKALAGPMAFGGA